MESFFSAAILDWFDHSGRKNLPWQKKITPYRVWISEIMLQQTQVATAIPYFIKFLSHFPNIEMLAQAPLDSVLHLWTGLGYYARARNIHKTAKIITTDYDGIFPSDLLSLTSLPGIGRSTAGAILSIAFQKSTPILDGNVRRVLARYHAVAGHPSHKAVESKLWSVATQYTPIERCADYTQAIMDLGATICTRTKPSCIACPLSDSCVAYKNNTPTAYPQPRKKPPIPVKNTQFLIIANEAGEILLEKRPPIGIWGGLWSFPEYQEDKILEYCKQQYGLKPSALRKGDLFRHTFSHFHLDITPLYITVVTKRLSVMDVDRLWCLPTDLPKVGLAAPVKNLLQSNFDSKKIKKE